MKTLFWWLVGIAVMALLFVAAVVWQARNHECDNPEAGEEE